MTPRIKPFIEYYWDDGAVHFSRVPATAIKIADSSKFVYHVCNVMDGILNIDEIKEKISHKYSDGINFIESLLSVLDNELLIEDTSINKVFSKSASVDDRWSRNVEFFGSFCNSSMSKYEVQEQIIDKKILILGLGGVGSNVLLNLVGLGIKNYHLVDFDEVEKVNLNRQLIYQYNDVGELKTECAKTRILKILPDANITYSNMFLSNYSEIEKITKGFDLIIAAIDLPRESILDWINKACVQSKTPYVCGGLDSRWSTCFSIIPGFSGCSECWKNQVEDKQIYQDIVTRNSFISAEISNVAIMPMISMVAGMISIESLKILTRLSPPSLGKLNAYDFVSNKITTVDEWGKDSSCHVCSHLT